jgi:hypothetical protein
LRSGSTPEAIPHFQQLSQAHALEENVSPQSPRPNLSTIDYSIMPDELTTRAAIATFFDRGEPLFHISTQEECDDLIRKVYSSENIATEADWCELSAIAALGCQYDGSFLPAATQSCYIQRTSSNLYNMFSAQALQSMRCFVSLSLCFALEKSTTARSFACKFCFVVGFRLHLQMCR